MLAAGWLALRGGTSTLTRRAAAATAAAGALAGDAALQVTCDAHGFGAHLLAFHAGGVLLAAARPAGAARGRCGRGRLRSGLRLGSSAEPVSRAGAYRASVKPSSPHRKDSAPMHLSATLAALVTLLAAVAARADELTVNPDAGNNSLSAVFDAKLGERITAVSSAVGCTVRWDERSRPRLRPLPVPLESIRVDNDDTKSDHFRQWATNKKSDPAACKLEAVFDGVRLGMLAPEQPDPLPGPRSPSPSAAAPGPTAGRSG